MDCRCKAVIDYSSPFDCVMFDLDDTLYPKKIGIAEACKKNIEEFLVQKCGFSESRALSLRVELFKSYGSSLAGLRALGNDVDADDYHSFVHGRLPYESIKPDPELRSLLRSITQRKVVFTNSDRNHANKVLDLLGVADCFDQIICFETMNPNLSKSNRPDQFPVLLKPSLQAMKIALAAAEVEPRRTLFLDDSVRNVAAGRAVGLRTVLVGNGAKSTEADYAVEAINNLREVVPEIWVSRVDGGDQSISRSRRDVNNPFTRPVTA